MRVLSLLLFTLISASCGASKKPIKLQVTGLQYAVSDTFPGGVMLYGANVTNNTKFAAQLNGTDSYTIESFKSEVWNFYAYAWSGPTPMTGEFSCAKAMNVAIGEASVIDLTLDKDKCVNESHMSPNGYYISSGVPYYGQSSIGICDTGTTTGNLNSCSYATVLATGVKVSLQQHPLRKFESNNKDSIALVSACGSFNYGNSYINAILPSPLNDDLFPAAIKYEVFYGGPSGCTGEGCCVGRKESYTFDRGLKASKNEYIFRDSPGNFGIKVAEKPATLVASINDSALVSLEFGPTACAMTNVHLKNPSNGIVAPVTSETVSISCNDTCTFYSDASCTTLLDTGDTAAITLTPLGGGVSDAFYVKPKGAVMKISSSGNATIGGSLYGPNQIPSTLAYMDEEYFRSIINHPTLFGEMFPNIMFDAVTFVPIGAKYAFRSNVSNNMGCISQIHCETYNNFGLFSVVDYNNISTTLTFDFKTYDSGSIIASGNSIQWNYSTINALDMEQMDPRTTYVSYEGDVAAQIIGPHLFNIQGNWNGYGAIFVRIPDAMIIP